MRRPASAVCTSRNSQTNDERADISQKVDSKNDQELRFAWDWFQYHASQRLTAFNFFLIVTSAVVVGYASAAANHSSVLGTGVAGVGAVVAVGFWAMDIRNAELVRYGRDALDHAEEGIPGLSIRRGDRHRTALEETLPGWLRNPLFGWVGKDEHRQDCVRTIFTHSFWLRTIIALIGLSFVAAAVWAATGY